MSHGDVLCLVGVTKARTVRGQGTQTRGETASDGEDASGAVNVDDLLAEALATMSVRDAAASVTAATGLPRKEIYSRALALSRLDPGGNDG